LPEELKNYKNIFLKKEAIKLLIFKEGNYIIKLKGRNPLYRLIYNLFKLKLKELYYYLNNIII